MNTLIIGDLHEPFSRKGYLDFCKSVQKDFKCTRTVFIGDLIDNHYPSYHETDPDGLGGGMELEAAINRIQEWYKEFPKAYVCLGNHDMLIRRKAYSNGIPKRWIKDFKEMFNTPEWEYEEQFEFDGVLYHHGTGTSGDKAALNMALHSRKSVVQGHLHSFASVQYTASEIDRLYGMIVGCGVDQKAYGFAYSKTYPKKFIVSCGVVLNNGKLPIVIPMEL